MKEKKKSDFIPKFTHINECFVCLACGKHVPQASSSCRNHCPYCLHSVHVDISPGDRESECKGVMRAVGFEITQAKGLQIRFQCLKCGHINLNKALLKDKNAPDDYDLILTLTPKGL